MIIYMHLNIDRVEESPIQVHQSAINHRDMMLKLLRELHELRNNYNESWLRLEQSHVNNTFKVTSAWADSRIFLWTKIAVALPSVVVFWPITITTTIWNEKYSVHAVDKTIPRKSIESLANCRYDMKPVFINEKKLSASFSKIWKFSNSQMKFGR